MNNPQDQFFQLMNMPRKARRAYQKMHGVKIPGIQDNPYVSTTSGSKDKREHSTDTNAQDVHPAEGKVSVHEPAPDAVHR